VGQHERVAGLAQELDEVAVVAGGDVREARVGGVDVGGHGGVQQLPKRRPLVRQGLHRAAAAPAAAAAAAVVVVVVMVVMVVVVLAVRRRLWARHARRCHGAPPQDVR